METSSQTKPVITSTDAVEQFVGDQFIDWLMDYITSEVRSWTVITQISEHKYKIEKIKKFMVQKFLDAKAVWGGKENDPGFLGFAIANLSEVSDPAAEKVLSMIEERYEQEQNGLTKALWLKFFSKLGVITEDLEKTEPKEPIRNYVSTLSDVYSSLDWQTTVGAWICYQKIIAFESKVLLDLLKTSLDFSDSELEVFKVYSEENKKFIINPTRLLGQLAVDRDNKELVMDGVNRQLEARKIYYEKTIKYLD